jgi:hypothetical protein
VASEEAVVTADRVWDYLVLGLVVAHLVVWWCVFWTGFFIWWVERKGRESRG